jgi:hypothetical protein
MRLEIRACGEGGVKMPSKKSLERTVNYRGRTVRAVALLRGPVRNGQQWPAVQRNL